MNSKGFSLLEALVALVVLSLVFSAVWGWFGSAATATSRIQHALALPGVFQQFTHYLELEDMQASRAGIYQIGDYVVDWQAIPLRQSNQERYRRQPAWIVTLFEIQAEVKYQDQSLSRMSTRIVKQWRDPAYAELPGLSQ
ncbi:prepilin-type N-terminal cleavage/methylation domain-containing protein [Bowmanella denitrificans]|uniref:prepilin-type N-terminal cleavage/methylation domain-containing protein n=1 Tax=Bowmanella denitrificans TaxID=366582 RepID=UPI000C9C603E|nr:prepilin-type N-terminal cleavage/methylation domain-containing protein [Bowmanella denitrificans]